MATHSGEIMPAAHYEAIVPHDSTNMARETQGVYVGVGGDVVVVTPAGVAVTFTGVPSGSILPIRTKRINATNTTATNLVALMTRAR